MNELTKTYPRFRRQKYNFFPKPQAFGLKKVFSFKLTIGFFSNRYADDMDVALRERDGELLLLRVQLQRDWQANSTSKNMVMCFFAHGVIVLFGTFRKKLILQPKWKRKKDFIGVISRVLFQESPMA